jgi:hypothetical protein
VGSRGNALARGQFVGFPVPRRRLAQGESLRHCNLATASAVAPECIKEPLKIKPISLALCGSCGMDIRPYRQKNSHKFVAVFGSSRFYA